MEQKSVSVYQDHPSCVSSHRLPYTRTVVGFQGHPERMLQISSDILQFYKGILGIYSEGCYAFLEPSCANSPGASSDDDYRRQNYVRHFDNSINSVQARIFGAGQASSKHPCMVYTRED